MDLHIGIGEAITLVISVMVAVFELAKATDEQRLRIRSWAGKALFYAIHIYSVLMPTYQLIKFAVQDGPASRHDIAFLAIYMVTLSAVLANYIAGSYARAMLDAYFRAKIDRTQARIDRLESLIARSGSAASEVSDAIEADGPTPKASIPRTDTHNPGK
ncbi:hypothetical protein NA655_08415 [Pseudomonas kuykendallii]|uniref:hypothetical protein n=1 Tax=Pseudomonas kuykendallii TaxID=1007099 RepID=UPI000B7C82AE|nr:hypothetical protein [Pseudomonas kuykendallii]MCQ4271042.1 hypothetical protein [Pseudomonas kuykendallii]